MAFRVTCQAAPPIRSGAICGGRGVCNDDGKCECTGGFAGVDCSLEPCPTTTDEDCSGHGTCSPTSDWPPGANVTLDTAATAATSTMRSSRRRPRRCAYWCNVCLKLKVKVFKKKHSVWTRVHHSCARRDELIKCEVPVRRTAVHALRKWCNNPRMCVCNSWQSLVWHLVCAGPLSARTCVQTGEIALLRRHMQEPSRPVRRCVSFVPG